MRSMPVSTASEMGLEYIASTKGIAKIRSEGFKKEEKTPKVLLLGNIKSARVLCRNRTLRQVTRTNYTKGRYTLI